jgi:5-methylcytosine-specific restriction endonuclease McrA
VIAIHNGGKHEWGNVRLACNGCNSRKQDKGQMQLAI